MNTYPSAAPQLSPPFQLPASGNDARYLATSLSSSTTIFGPPFRSPHSSLPNPAMSTSDKLKVPQYGAGSDKGAPDLRSIK